MDSKAVVDIFNFNLRNVNDFFRDIF